MAFTTKLSDWFVNLTRLQKAVVRIMGVAILAIVLVFIFVLPLTSVPMDIPIAQGSPEAERATTAFWEIFHANQPDKLPQVLDDLTAAYVRDANDPVLTTVLAGAHLWRFQMRSRFGESAEQARDHVALTLKYARETKTLLGDPLERDSTVPSIITTAHWQTAVLEGDDELRLNSHIDLLSDTQVYPEFAGFVQGWILGAMLPPDDPRYSESPKGYDIMLDACAGFDVPKGQKFNRIIHSLYSLKTLVGDRTCYNNPVAPHNIEGTFLAMGDIYLKQGDLASAQLWYENVQTAPTYATWQYQDVLAGRLANLASLSAKFVADGGTFDVGEPAMSFQSDISCGVCHTQ